MDYLVERGTEKQQINIDVYKPKEDEFFVKKTAWLTTVVSNPLPHDFDFERASRLGSLLIQRKT